MERKVVSISDIDGNIKVTFNDTEYCMFHRFGKDILTTTSPGVLKKTLVNLKKDVKDTNFNVEELKKLWITVQLKIREEKIREELIKELDKLCKNNQHKLPPFRQPLDKMQNCNYEIQ